MTHFHSYALCIAISASLIPSCCIADETGISKTNSTGQLLWDNICGPRCVQRVLEHYGQKNVSLIDLIKECQWPALESGSSIEQIEQCLKKRGVFTKTFIILPGVHVEWNKPVIALMTTGTSLDHFVVLEPSAPDSQRRTWVWDASGPEQTGSINGRFHALILTSDSLDNFNPVFEQSARALWDYSVAWLIAFATAINLLLLCCWMPLFSLRRVRNEKVVC